MNEHLFLLGRAAQVTVKVTWPASNDAGRDHGDTFGQSGAPGAWSAAVGVSLGSRPGRQDVALRIYLDEFQVHQVGQGAQVGDPVAGAERPVVGDAGGAPGVGPLTRVHAEVHA